MDYRSRQDKSPKKEVGCSKGVQDGGSERKNVSMVWGGTNELSKQAMFEEKNRQKKHFQMVLKSWESLLEKEKDEKLSALKEKVEIQRQLIRKIDEQREMKNHLMKQEKDKKKKQPQVNNKPSLIASHPARRNQTRLPTNKIMTPDIVEQMVEASDVEEDTNTSNQNDTQPLATEPPQQLQESNKEKVNHETQERQVQIEDLWMNLKTHSNKKLKTFQSHLDRLKEISSPSVKECLQIYNQSRLNNSSVGQPVSLSMMLKNMKESTLPNDKMHTLTIARASADIKSKCTRQMLHNSQLVQSTNNNSDINWFTGLNLQQSSNNKSLEPLKETQFSVDTFTTSVRGPKISFLKEDKSITSTENILKSVTIQEPIKKERLSTRWHPLSLNALGEYQSVKETTTSGNGPFRNGIATLWKQAEAIHQQ